MVLGQPHETGYKATAGTLNAVTDAATSHDNDPKAHIHAPADAPHAHNWLTRHFNTSALTSTLENLENKYHMGNYVLDRQTGAKSWEAMSVYVRLGMHLLYYGSEQEKMLHAQRVVALLKEQSEKMGVEYDKPESRDHIVPFLESFGLRDSMAEMIEPDPAKYPTFNAFFAREIKPEARPIDEPANEAVTSSPADCRLTAFPTVDAATK